MFCFVWVSFAFLVEKFLSQFTCYKLNVNSVVVHWDLVLRFWVDLFVLKGRMQSETTVSKKVSTCSKDNKTENEIKTKFE